MNNDSPTQSLPAFETRNQQPDIIRPDYVVQVIDGQKSVIPNAFQGLDLPLAYMDKPDYSKAMDMAGGVSRALIVVGRQFILIILLHICIPTRNTDPDHLNDLAWGNQKVV